MRVAVTVGTTTREGEVRSDLITGHPSPQNDSRQDAASSYVGRLFTEAYRAEIEAVVGGKGLPLTAEEVGRVSQAILLIAESTGVSYGRAKEMCLSAVAALVIGERT